MIAHQMREKSPIMCLDFNTEGDKFATAGNDVEVRIYDDEKKALIQTMKSTPKHPGHNNRIFSLCFHKEIPNLLASGGWDKTVQFYDLRTGSVTNSIFSGQICGDAIDLKEHMLLTGAWDEVDQVQIFDIRNFKQMKLVDFPKDKSMGYCYTAQFTKIRNSYIYGVGCSNSNIVRMYDNENNDLPIMDTELYKTCYTVDYSYDGKYFAYGSGDGVIRILDIEKEQEEKKVEEDKKVVEVKSKDSKGK